MLNLLLLQVLALLCQIDPKKAPALDTISTALPTSVPSSNALTLVGLCGGITIPLGVCETVVRVEGCGGNTRSGCLILESGEFEGVGCLDRCNCSSSVLSGIGMGNVADTAGPRSKHGDDIRKGLLP